MTRFVEIAREGGVRLLCDRETLKEYPLTIETAINIANHLNDEILDFDEILIKTADKYDKDVKNRDGLILGDVLTTSFNAVVDLMPLRTKLHNQSNVKMYREFGAFDKDGKFKGYKKDVDVKLLEKIRHELVSIGGLRATDYNCPATGYVSLRVDDLVDLDFTELIKEIDEVLE